MGLKFKDFIKAAIVGTVSYFSAGTAGPATAAALGVGSAGLSLASSSEQNVAIAKQKELQNRALALEISAKSTAKRRRAEGALVTRERSRRRLRGGLSSTIFGGSPVGGGSTLG